MLLPDDREIRALHEGYAPTPQAFESVYTHSQIVWGVAQQLLGDGHHALDADLVRVGCLLHDMGVYLLYRPSGELDHARYVRHGVLGYELLAEEGFPEAVRRFCSHHTGVGLSRGDVRSQGLPVPVADYFAESGEEEVVMYADKFHSKTEPPVFVSADTYARSVRRFGEDKALRFAELRERFGDPDLSLLARAHEHALV